MAEARWALLALLLLVLFFNHWARDSVGALETKIEADVPAGGLGLTVAQYNRLTSAYFLPNVIAPLLAGVAAQRIGASNMLVVCLAVSLAGGIALALGAWTASYAPLLLGRLVMGLPYEAIDVLPLPLLTPYFPDRWATACAIINGGNRLGSILNFATSPYAYHRLGIGGALTAPAACALLGLGAGVAARRASAVCEVRARAAEPSGARRERPRDEPAQLPLRTPADLRDALTCFSATFWLYLLGAAGAYGAMVPFWFIGARTPSSHGNRPRRMANLSLLSTGARALEDLYGIDLEAADALLTIPEGAIMIVAPPLGWLLDRYTDARPPRRRLLLAAGALALVPAAYAALLLCARPPRRSPLAAAVLVCALGAAYASAQTITWSVFVSVSHPQLTSLGAGLIGAAINLLPAALPAIAFGGDATENLRVLGAVGLAGAACFAAAAWRSKPDGRGVSWRIPGVVESPRSQGGRARKKRGGLAEPLLPPPPTPRSSERGSEAFGLPEALVL